MARTPDRVFVAVCLVLAAGSAAVLLQPVAPLRIVAPALDLTEDTIAMVVASVVTMLAWVRYLERRDVQALYQAAAFFAVTMANVAAVATTLVAQPNSTLATGEPGPDQVYVFVAGRLLCAILLVAGSARAPLRISPRFRLAPPAIAATVMILVIAIVASDHALPTFVVVPADGSAPHLTSLGVAAHLLSAALFLVAAWLTRANGMASGSLGDRYLALAYVVAAFALVHGAVYPGTHPGPVTSADALWFVFYAVLLLAIEAEARTALSALRRANRELDELRQVEVERAAMQERERLSRELHDGLAQDLWLAKLKVSRLGAVESLDSEARTLVEDLSDAVEQSLAEARQAVIAMRQPLLEGVSFGRLLHQYLEDHADRFGLALVFEGDADLPDLPARTQAELLRIAQEALANVRRHSGATEVVVRTTVQDGAVLVAISDNGHGFDLADLPRARFGVTAMHERASIIGGQLRIYSQSGEGTRVEITVPLHAPPRDGVVPAGAAS